ncbi:MAG: hypothetical protein EXR72_16295 [Myxococcales bacterium]|nr:hypothetical protein [Myxococcales bacterium]
MEELAVVVGAGPRIGGARAHARREGQRAPGLVALVGVGREQDALVVEAEELLEQPLQARRLLHRRQIVWLPIVVAVGLDDSVAVAIARGVDLLVAIAIDAGGELVGDLGHRRLAAEGAIRHPHIAIGIDRGPRRVVVRQLHLLPGTARLLVQAILELRPAIDRAAAVLAVAGLGPSGLERAAGDGEVARGLADALRVHLGDRPALPVAAVGDPQGVEQQRAGRQGDAAARIADQAVVELPRIARLVALQRQGRAMLLVAAAGAAGAARVDRALGEVPRRENERQVGPVAPGSGVVMASGNGERRADRASSPAFRDRPIRKLPSPHWAPWGPKCPADQPRQSPAGAPSARRRGRLLTPCQQFGS